MSRRDNVLAAVLALSRERRAIAGTPAAQGVTTEEIAQRAGILRNNCSAELNGLVRDGYLLKIPGRPARYRMAGNMDSNVGDANGATYLMPLGKPLTSMAAGRYDASTVPLHYDVSAPLHYSASTPLHYDAPAEDSFDWGIATERSLREAVQQAKIALSYPPHGMHVLLLGETGAGKSTFSRRMHQYAVQHGVLRKGAPFVTFNCSEYASNPEILLSQLFGYIRGAFTGAHGDKPGLVEQAHQGMLFLDEVHRLPPQGQEMLFHLLDYGQFRRLGETQMGRMCRILLVAATTESPESALLSTFRRRIPVVIRLPALRDWSLYDRYELVYSLCQEEARTLKRPVCITAPALDKLLFSRFTANIGDLKNTLKLACARAYTVRDGGMIQVLSEHVVAPDSDGPNTALLRRLAQMADLVVTPDAPTPPLPILEEASRYAKLDRLSLTLQELGFATEEILDALEREVRKQEHDDQQAPSSISELRQFVGEPLFYAFSRAWAEIEHGLSEEDKEAAFVRVAIHLSGVVRNGRPIAFSIDSDGLVDLTNRVRREYPEFYDLAGQLLRKFTVESGIALPAQEVPILAMLLHPNDGDMEQPAGIVVALQGDSIARSIVDTALRLHRDARVTALDVPLQTSLEEMDDELTRAVLGMNSDRGVLLLTDIERFMEGGGWQPPEGVSLARVIRPDLRTVTAAIRALHTPSADVHSTVKWLNVIHPEASRTTSMERRVVWACCLTGKGTARAVQRLIREALPTDLSGRVEIVPKELAQAKSDALVPDEGLVAAVGSVNPGIFGVPFFSVETLFRPEGIEQLLNVLYLGDAMTHPGVYSTSMRESGATLGGGGEMVFLEATNQSNDLKSNTGHGQGEHTEMEAHIRKLLHRDLVYVNPELAQSAAREMWERVLRATQGIRSEVPMKYETYIRFCLHMAYVIERLVRGEGMLHPYTLDLADKYPTEWAIMMDAWKPIEDVFRLPVHTHELAYLFEIVFAKQEIEVFDA